MTSQRPESVTDENHRLVVDQLFDDCLQVLGHRSQITRLPAPLAPPETGSVVADHPGMVGKRLGNQCPVTRPRPEAGIHHDHRGSGSTVDDVQALASTRNESAWRRKAETITPLGQGFANHTSAKEAGSQSNGTEPAHVPQSARGRRPDATDLFNGFR
mgnify:CR=1 FL=1